MPRRLQPQIACGMLVLYTGMTLCGEFLHEFLGCEHDHNRSAAVTLNAGRVEATSSLPAVSAPEFVHDSDSCPLCQFHAQGQLVSPVAGGELKQIVVVAPPVRAPLVFVVCELDVHGPRPPPGV